MLQIGYKFLVKNVTIYNKTADELEPARDETQ